MSVSPSMLLTALLIVELGSMAVIYFSGPDGWTAPQPIAPAAESVQAVEVAAAPRVGEFLVQVERPLFVPGRRPPAADPLVPDQPEVLDFQVLGIFGVNDAEGGVIIRTANEVKRVGVGQRLGAMTLVRLDGMEAVFLNGAREQRVKITPLPRAAPPEVAGQPRNRQQLGVPGQRGGPPAPVQAGDIVDPAVSQEFAPPPITQ